MARRVLKILAGLSGLIVLCAGVVVVLHAGPYPYAPAGPTEFGEFEPLTHAVPRREADRTVVLLVFDGLAPGIVAAADTPNLDRMAAQGAHTSAMRPVFPTLSMPNHYSLSTGCQPERHGFVSNRFVDPGRGLIGNVHDADWLLDCEPIHVAAERQGIRSAVLGWFGAVSSSRGALATIAVPARTPMPSPSQQVDSVIGQLRRPKRERPGLITAYSSEPDHTAHDHGVGAPATLEMAQEVDRAIGQLLDAVQAMGQRDEVVVLVTTDHGMIDADEFVNINAVVRRHGVDAMIAAEGSIANLYLTDPTTVDDAKRKLQGSPYFDVIDPRSPPPYAHFGDGPRVGQLVLSLRPPSLPDLRPGSLPLVPALGGRARET